MFLLLNGSLLIGLFLTMKIRKKKHQHSNENIFYLIKLEEQPELLLGTGGGSLSISEETLNLEIIGGDTIFLRSMIIQNISKEKILHLGLNKLNKLKNKKVKRDLPSGPFR